LKTPWVRLVLVVSLDGRIALPCGGKTQLGSKADRHVLEEALAWSDGALLGGRTLRAHRNTCLINNHNLLKQRQSEGRSKQPIAIVVSNQKDVNENLPFFNQPIERWLVSSNEASTKYSLASYYERQFMLQANNWSETLSQIAQAGLSRLVLLGGAQLVGSFLKDDQVDELQITLAPKIIGGEFTWVPNDVNNLPQALAQSNAWLLKESQSLIENELLLRYVRNHSPK